MTMVIMKVTLYIPTMFDKKMMALVKQMKMINQLMVMKMIKKLATSGRPAGSNWAMNSKFGRRMSFDTTVTMVMMIVIVVVDIETIVTKVTMVT